MNPNEVPVSPQVSTSTPTSSLVTPVVHKSHVVQIFCAVAALIVVAAVVYIFQGKSAPVTEDQNVVVNDTVNGFSKSGYYVGEYEGADAVAYFDEKKPNEIYVNKKTDGGFLGTPAIDAATFSNPVLALDDTNKKYGGLIPLGFIVDRANNYVYLSMYYDTTPGSYASGEANEIIGIDVNTGTQQVLHRHIIGDETYTQKGALYLREIVGEWLIATVTGCFHCDGGTSYTVVAINKNDGREKYIGMVGNIQADIANSNVVRYQMLARKEVACAPGEGGGEVGPCSVGQTTKSIYVPEGATITTNLSDGVQRLVPVQ